VGITGANFLVAENGANVLVTNEGNGNLTCTMPRVHIVTTGIEKLVPTLEDATAMLRLLTRSATGQEFSAYATLGSGPRRAGDLDGPEEYHVVLVSSEDSPTSLNFLPEFHIVLVHANQLPCHVEDVWSQPRAAGPSPRTVNFITGPSKTADVEQTIQYGAHGPRGLDVIFIE